MEVSAKDVEITYLANWHIDLKKTVEDQRGFGTILELADLCLIKISFPLATNFERVQKNKIIRATTTSRDSELDFQDAGVEAAHGKSAAYGTDILIGRRDGLFSKMWAVLSSSTKLLIP